MNLELFAHAGEEHETTTNSLWHLLSSEWYYLLPTVIIFSLMIIMLTYQLSNKSLGTTAVTTEIVLFVGGILTFNTLPYYSIASITIGFALSLFLVINGLRNQN